MAALPSKQEAGHYHEQAEFDMDESSGSGPAPIELAVTSDAECIPGVRRRCQELALAIGFDEEQTKMIMLVMDEALSNVIKHGYHGASGQPIQVRLEQVADRGRPGIFITVRDRACQVDPGTIRSRDLDDIRPGGLGVHLMKTVMDTVEHSCCEDGMVLEMVKYVVGSGSEPAKSSTGSA